MIDIEYFIDGDRVKTVGRTSVPREGEHVVLDNSGECWKVETVCWLERFSDRQCAQVSLVTGDF